MSQQAGESAADPVSIERRGSLTIITLQRPAERNAVDPATARALYQAMLGFDADLANEMSALQVEFHAGLGVLRKEARTGAARFAAGAGRHGTAED